MTGPNRHVQRKASTHQHLIDAARELIVEKGYHQVDILDITERANVGKATFYKHFPNKEECVREMMHQGFDALVEQILNTVRNARPDDMTWIVESLATVFDWAEANREILRIMVGGAASSQLNMFGRHYAVQVIERTILDRLAPCNPYVRFPVQVQAQVITGVLIQLLGWWLENETGYTAREMAELIYNILHSGMGAGLDLAPDALSGSGKSPLTK